MFHFYYLANRHTESLESGRNTGNKKQRITIVECGTAFDDLIEPKIQVKTNTLVLKNTVREIPT